MTELLTTSINLFKSVSLVESAVFVIYMLIAGTLVFLIKVWFPRYLDNRKMEIERENRKTEILETTLKNISVVLQSNTDVMQGFNKSIYILEDTLEKVSDKLFAHDERSKYLSESIKGINNELLRLKEDAPTINDINLLHQKIDEVKSNVADKKDINLIISKLDQILETVATLKGKIM